MKGVVVGRALGRGEPEYVIILIPSPPFFGRCYTDTYFDKRAPNGAALGREEVRGIVGAELKETLLSDIRKRKGRPLKHGKCPGSWPL